MCNLSLIFSHEIVLDVETQKLSEQHNFDARGYAFTAEQEEIRKPRIVRIAAVQNSIVEPTTEKVSVQRDALHAKISNIIRAAAASNVNIICLQEAWSNKELSSDYDSETHHFIF